MLSRCLYRKTPTVLQMEASECGAASLAMVLSCYGQDVSLERLRMETNVNRDGCKASNIVKAARARGFQCGGFRKTADQLFEMNPPCIIFWEQNHFLVYEGVRRDCVYINDPAFGERKLQKEEFRKAYSGIVISITPGRGVTEPRTGTRRRRARELAAPVVDSIRQRPAVFAAALVLSGVSAFACIASAMGIGKLPTALLFTAVFFVCMLIRNHIVGTHQYQHTIVMSGRFMGTLMSLPMAFFEQRFPMDTVSRVSAEERVSRFASGPAYLIAADAAAVIILPAALLLADIRAGAIGLVCVAAGFAAALLIGREAALENNRQRVLTGKMAGKLLSAMSNTDMIKSSAGEDAYSAEQVGYQRELQAGDEKIRKMMLLSEAVIAAGEMLAFILAANAAGAGNTGTALALLLFLVIMLNAVALRAMEFRGITQDLAKTRDVREYVSEQEGDGDRDTLNPIDSGAYKKLSGSIIFDDVSFGYGRNEACLIENFSRRISAGSCVGITGGTGSGKTTLLKLAAGLYRPDSGEIYFDKKKREEIPEEVLATSIAFAMQKPQLFPGSIRDNISMWNPQITEESIVRAAKDACIHDVIMEREAGYDSEVTENGSNFSGGQKQRLEIARALAVDPSIIFLDEVTSGLDQETAEQVIRNIQKRGCTCLIVSYQKSIIDSCDEVITL